jgi:tRNA (guanine6-N2)-methyltransferase
MASPPIFNLMARATRGLEWVVAAELKGRLDADIVSVCHREVHFRLPQMDPRLSQIRTADDLFLSGGTVDGIDHTRASLQRLSDGISRLDLDATLENLGQIRTAPRRGPFDVVGSFLGKRNYNRFEIEAAAGQAITDAFDAPRQPDAHRSGASVSWRVHLRSTDAYIGLRLLPTPLHRRDYRAEAYKGSLHPPVAAAMALLAGLHPDTILLDPCCGSGTVGLEAAHLQNRLLPLASDISPTAVSQARRSAIRASVPLAAYLADAGRLPLTYRAVDRVCTNVPWGRTVPPSGSLHGDDRPFWDEIRRVSHSESRIVVLAEDDEFANTWNQPRDFSVLLQRRISMRGRWSTLSVFSLDSHSDPAPIDPWGLWGEELIEMWQRYATDAEPLP